MQTTQVAALYVDPRRGPYASIPGVDLWDIERNAKAYPGPHPIVAHPPCGPWGPLSWNCTKQDPTCGPIAVDQVIRWGGVLEHPKGSKLWQHCNLPTPFQSIPLFAPRVWALSIDQCRFGHPCLKPTWLLFAGVAPSSLPPLPPPRTPTHSIGCNADARAMSGTRCLPKSQRHITPPAFAAWLIAAVTA